MRFAYFFIGGMIFGIAVLAMRRRFRQKFTTPTRNHRTTKEILATIIDGPNHE